MKKLSAILLFCAVLAVSCTVVEDNYPMVTAHRSCWLPDYVPENSTTGVMMAARFGYPAIECDVHYTADSVMVLMHDGTINRTMRNAADYSVIEEPVYVSKTTFEELRTKYVLASTNPEYRTQIPTFEEQLDACIKYGVMPMMHSDVIESYYLAKEKLGDKWIGFTANYDALVKCREISDCLILLDPGRCTSEEAMKKAASIGGNIGISTMKHDMLDAQYIADMTAGGYQTQSSIFPTPHEMQAIHDNVGIILSDWVWFQTEGRKPVQTWKGRNTELNAGEEISTDFGTLEFSAMTFDITFTGTVEIVLNGVKSYTVTHETEDSESIGIRMHETDATIAVKAVDNSVIKSYRGRFYEI